jgi:CheY-like chemotaxis protein
MKLKQLKKAFQRILCPQSQNVRPLADRTQVPVKSAAIGKRVLVVDDNYVNQRVAQSMLRRLGYTHVDCVGDGYEAVSAVREGSYDLVLMDVSMPRMNGLDATKIIRELPGCQLEELVIFGLSAGAIEGDREHALEAGMNGYLSKPFKLKELRAALDHF